MVTCLNQHTWLSSSIIKALAAGEYIPWKIREKKSRKYKNEKYCAFFTTYQFSLAEIYPSRNLLMQQNFIFEIKRVELGEDKLEEKEFKDKYIEREMNR